MDIQIEATEVDEVNEGREQECIDITNVQTESNENSYQNKNPTKQNVGLTPVAFQLGDVRFVQLAIDLENGGGEVEGAIFDDATETDPKKTLYVKFHKPIEVAKFKNEEGLYLSAAFSQVPWPNLDACGNAVWLIVREVLGLSAGEVGYAQGLLVVGTHFYPAAKFVLAEGCCRNIDDPAVQQRISVCMQLLADRALWKYDVAAAPLDESARLVETARRAREQISGKKLPCACSIESAMWQQPIEVQRDLVESKPVVTNELERNEVGTITGYCRERHMMHFRIERTGKLVDICFDAETFFLRLFKVIRLKPKTLRVKWMERFEGLNLSSSTLKEFEVISEALC